MPARFQNQHPHDSHHVGHILQWKLGLRREGSPEVAEQWIRADDLQAIAVNSTQIEAPDQRCVQVTWIGHASFLVQVAGRNFLFDPVFDTYCSPLPLPGLKRLHPPALTLSDLPKLDGVFVSHNHYDHLEKRTIRALGATVSCHAPVGLSNWLGRLGVRDCSEYAWWDAVPIDDELTVHCVPAQHFSSRGLHDRNQTLWCGWVLEMAGFKIYFVGDTGYAPLFREIRQRIGAMDVSIIPIGAYRPRSVMQPVHVDPCEAVAIHLDVESRHSIASHWGTFRLTDEPLWEPPALLRQACNVHEVSADEFRILRIGETCQFS